MRNDTLCIMYLSIISLLAYPFSLYIFLFSCVAIFLFDVLNHLYLHFIYTCFMELKKKCYYFLFVINQSNLFFSSVHLHIFSSIHVFAHVFFICMVVGFLITFLIRPVGREGQQKLYECYYIAAKLIMIIFSPIKFLFIKNVIILEGLCPLKIKISRFNSFLPGNLISVRRFLQKEGCIS